MSERLAAKGLSIMNPEGSQPEIDSGFVGGGSGISSVPAVLAGSGDVRLTAGSFGFATAGLFERLAAAGLFERLAVGELFACCAMAAE